MSGNVSAPIDRQSITVAGTDEIQSEIFKLFDKPLDGFLKVYFEVTTATESMNVLTLKVRGAKVNSKGNWKLLQGAALTIDTALDMSVVNGEPKGYSLNQIYADSGDEEKFLDADGLYFFIAGDDATSAGVVLVTLDGR